LGSSSGLKQQAAHLSGTVRTSKLAPARFERKEYMTADAAGIASIAITLFAIAAGSLFNNVRISDSANALNKRIDDANSGTAKRFEDLRDFIHSENLRLEQKLDRIAETLMTVIHDHEQRIRAIERHPS
jgi:predicted PurR-regulated permease PerM